MKYDVELPTLGHNAKWLKHHGDRGTLQFDCIGEGSIFIDSGWGNFTVCPVCGEEIHISVEEVVE